MEPTVIWDLDYPKDEVTQRGMKVGSHVEMCRDMQRHADNKKKLREEEAKKKRGNDSLMAMAGAEDNGMSAKKKTTPGMRPGTFFIEDS